MLKYSKTVFIACFLHAFSGGLKCVRLITFSCVCGLASLRKDKVFYIRIEL